MIRKLRNKLNKEGRKFGWFFKTYLPDKSYQSLMQEIHGYVKLKDETVKAIEKYIGE